jgi:CIC family chloride channel protein
MADTGRRRQVALIWLCGLAFAVGGVAGGGAVLFRALIAFIHNLFFNGTLSLAYDANLLTPPSPFGPLIILAPVIGGMGVVFLVRHFAPEARGHGVPEIMDAIYYREGHIRPVVAATKSLASALAIGSGASVGREGPIAQIGASFGSTMGLLTGLIAWQRITLVAAGAGAGIAATFNTPLGGVLFAIELLMPEISPRTFLPVVIATGTATYIGRFAFGLSPAFNVPFAIDLQVGPATVETALAVVVLGVLCGLASWAFIRTLAWMEDLFPRLPGNDYSRHAIGMLLLGVLMYALMLTTGHYQVDGVGYGTIQAVLEGQLVSTGLLAALFAAKLIATSLTLGSGSSGGIFSPSLFMGATLGGAFGSLVLLIWPDFQFQPPDFAMVAMGGVVAGATGATMTAIIMMFEMTRDYHIVLPLIIAVGISVGLRRVLSSENIYTIKLTDRGHSVPKDRHSNMYLVRHAKDVMETRTEVVAAETPLAVVRAELPEDVETIVVGRHGRIAGVVRAAALAAADGEAAPDATLSDIVERRFLIAHEDEILHDVLTRMARRGVEVVLVVGKNIGIPRAADVLGVLGREQIGACILEHYVRSS